jgi:hypothetical protein
MSKNYHDLLLGATIITTVSFIAGLAGYGVDLGRGGKIITAGDHRATIIVGILALFFGYFAYITRGTE